MSDVAMWGVGIAIGSLVSVISAAWVVVGEIRKTSTNETIQKKDIESLQTGITTANDLIKEAASNIKDLTHSVISLDTDLRVLKETDKKREVKIEALSTDVIKLKMIAKLD